VARVSVVLDSSIVIDWLRGIPASLAYLAQLQSPPICSEVTRVEVIRGLRSEERARTERAFGEIAWIPVDESIARHAGELGRRWRRSHPGIGTPDLIIAATAERLGFDVATRNVRHFPMFRGLRAPYRP
jgi:predicted nucleic acid-binding protein